MSEVRYLIYLTGKVFDEYSYLQEYFRSNTYDFTSSSLGMHCTVLHFDSYYDDSLVKNHFNTETSALSNNRIQNKPIHTIIQKADLFENESVVLRLKKVYEIEKLHWDCIAKFNQFRSKYEFRHQGLDYSPHLTIGHIPGIISLPKLPIDIIGKDVSLDRLILAKKENGWKILSEKILI